MSGSEFAAIRKSLGLTHEQWGLALGYSATTRSAEISVRRLEARGKLNIPTTIARLAYMFDRFGIPDEWAYNYTGDVNV